MVFFPLRRASGAEGEEILLVRELSAGAERPAAAKLMTRWMKPFAIWPHRPMAGRLRHLVKLKPARLAVMKRSENKAHPPEQFAGRQSRNGAQNRRIEPLRNFRKLLLDELLHFQVWLLKTAANQTHEVITARNAIRFQSWPDERIENVLQLDLLSPCRGLQRIQPRDALPVDRLPAAARKPPGRAGPSIRNDN